MTILQKENSLLKREMALQKAQQAMEVVPKPTPMAIVTKATRPVILLALIAAAVVTGNGWFLVFIMFLLFD
jgi:hypothetical protein